MTWEEWKEGLARHLENRVRDRLGLPQHRPEPGASFNRVTFYRGGELFITRLTGADPALAKDLQGLNDRIVASGEKARRPRGASRGTRAASCRFASPG